MATESPDSDGRQAKRSSRHPRLAQAEAALEEARNKVKDKLDAVQALTDKALRGSGQLAASKLSSR